jgi:hypothetical protein
VVIDNIALHLDPEVWPDINPYSDSSWVTVDDKVFPDECTFCPSRCIDPVGSTRRIYQPPKGYFIPLGHGPRVCPGQKTRQIEFAAVLLKLLQRYRIDAVPLIGKGLRDVEQRLDKMLNNSISKMTLILDGIYDAGKNEGVRMRLSRRR